MAKIVLSDTISGYDLTKINYNFQKVAEAFNDKVLWRDNIPGEPNALISDIDVNSKRLYNLPAPSLSSQAARLQDVQNALNGVTGLVPFPANLIPFSPAQNITPTNVQGAIEFVNTYKATGTGSVDQTLAQKLNIQEISVEDYGAIGDDNTDDTLAIQRALNAAVGKIVRLTSGKIYRVTDTLLAAVCRGIVGAATIKWAGEPNANKALIDCSMNSGCIIQGWGGEMTLRCDTPSTCKIGIRMAGGPNGSFPTFQSKIRDIGIFGSGSPDATPNIGIDGGTNGSIGLNDGSFFEARIEGFDISYQFVSPDNKVIGGTNRPRNNGTWGWAFNIAQAGRVRLYGHVVSQCRYVVRLASGVWGLTAYGCHFEGIEQGMTLFDSPLSELYEPLSFYDCLFSTDNACPSLFDTTNWRPGAVMSNGVLRIQGGSIINTAVTGLIVLHNDSARNPLTVIVDGINDDTEPLTWSGNISRVHIRKLDGRVFQGQITKGVARIFYGTGSPTWSSIAAGDRDVRTISVPGVRFDLDEAIVSTSVVDGIFQNGLFIEYAWVSADNIVSIVVANRTSGPLTPTTRKLSVKVETF